MSSGVKVGELYGELRLEKGKFDHGVDDSGLKLGKLAGIATKAGAIVATALIGAGVAAGGMAINFEKGMANVQTLLGSGSAAEARIGEFKTSVKDLSVSTGSSLADMTDGIYQVISAWGDTADTSKILEISAKSAKAGLATTTDAVNLLSTVTKGYGDTSAEAVQKAADLAFQTANLGQTTFPELAASMGKVIPLAATMKVGQEELFGAMATLTGVTGNTAEVSTQLRAVLSALINANPNMVKALKSQGFASGRAAIETKGLSGTLDVLKKAAGGSDLKLAQMLGSSEALNAVLALTGNQAEDFKNKTLAMAEAGGKNTKTWDEFTKAIHAGLTDAEAIAEGWDAPGVTREFKDNLGLTDEQVKKFLDDLNKLGETKALENLKSQVQGVTGATETAFAIQQKTVSASLDKIGASVQVLLVNLGEKFLPVLNDILSWVVANMPAIQATIEGVFSAVGDAISWVVKNVIPVLIEAFQRFTRDILPVVAEAFTTVVGALTPLVSQALPALGEAFATIVDAAGPLLEVIRDNLAPILAGLATFLIGQMVQSILATLPLLAAKAAAWWAVASAVIAANAPLVLIALAVAAVIKILDHFGLLAPLVEAVTRAMGAAFQWVSTNVMPAVGAAIRTAGGVIRSVVATVTPILQAVASVLFPALSTAAGIMGKLIGVAFGVVGNYFRTLAGIATVVVNAIKAAWTPLSGFFSGLWNGITGTVKGAINLVISVINGMIRALNSIQIHIPEVGVGPVHTPAFDWNGLNLGQLPYLASGVRGFKGGWAMVGEKGPELAHLPGGADVFSNAESGRMLSNMGGRLGASASIGEYHEHIHLQVDGLVRVETADDLGVQARRAARFGRNALLRVAQGKVGVPVAPGGGSMGMPNRVGSRA